MRTSAKSTQKADQYSPSEYIIQIYSADGRFLSEYSLDARKHRLEDINDAERHAREKLETANFGTTIVIVSSQVPDAFDQVHIKVAANDPD